MLSIASFVRLGALPCAALLSLAGCVFDETGSGDGSPYANADLAGSSEAAIDGGAGSAVDFVVQGCAERTAEQCVGAAPLRLTFVPIGVGPEMVASWDLGDGSQPQQVRTVTHTFVQPGPYTVTLTVSGEGGTESERKVDLVLVRAAVPGGPCRDSSGCAFGACVCAEGECQPALAGGLCLQACSAGSPCPEQTASECVDLTGGGASAGDSALEAWRTRLCLPGCDDDDDCVRPGFACRSARSLDGGWSRACVPPQPLPLGDPCRDSDGDLSPNRCVGAACLDLGAGGYCSSICGPGECPDGSDCVRFSGDVGSGGEGVCLERCAGDGSTCQNDALLRCEAPNSSGNLGFALPGSASPAVSGYCAPRRCSEDQEICGIGGRCDVDSGGFCVTDGR